jgi:hypothetical protein
MTRAARYALAAGVCATLGIAHAAHAQEPPKSPPSWETLAHCADMPDSAKELECYRAAMRAAGYVRSPDRVAAERHKTFGIELPGGHKQGEKAKPSESAQAQPTGPAAGPNGEDASHIKVRIVEIAYTRPLNQLLIVTDDGGVWEQTDTIPLTFTPKAGDPIEIRKTAFGGYFCKFDRTNAVRCERKN